MRGKHVKMLSETPSSHLEQLKVIFFICVEARGGLGQVLPSPQIRNYDGQINRFQVKIFQTVY